MTAENKRLPIHCDLRGKRVFVTGGSGFVGTEVVKQLVTSYEAHVCCLVRSSSPPNRWGSLAVETVVGDILEPESYRDALRSCDAVIHLASLSNWNDLHSPLMHKVVVEATTHLLSFSQEEKPRPFVYVSSVAAINGTDTPVVQDEGSLFSLYDAAFVYAQAKRKAEQACLESAQAGNPVVIVNPAEVYGPFDERMITAGNLQEFLAGKVVLTCHGGTAVVHVEDVATGIMEALQRGQKGERYILAGENVTIRALAQKTLYFAGQKKSVWTLPNGLVRTLALLQKHTGLPLGANPAVIPYALKYWFVSSRKAREELGVTFRSADETLRPTVEWLLSLS